MSAQRATNNLACVRELRGLRVGDEIRMPLDLAAAGTRHAGNRMAYAKTGMPNPVGCF